MNVMLSYELPEEESELRAAIDAMDHIAAINAFKECLYSLKKYGHNFETTDQAISNLYNDYCDVMQRFI